MTVPDHGCSVGSWSVNVIRGIETVVPVLKKQNQTLNWLASVLSKPFLMVKWSRFLACPLLASFWHQKPHPSLYTINDTSTALLVWPLEIINMGIEHVMVRHCMHFERKELIRFENEYPSAQNLLLLFSLITFLSCRGVKFSKVMTRRRGLGFN